jgi:Ca2+-transporting ATPase
MVLVFIAAGVISFIFHPDELADSIVIFVVVLINAIMGVAQESKAEKAIEALKKMSSPYSKVKRNGEVKRIPSEELVPGDIVLLEAGDFVPADLRLIESASLKIEEAALTGESQPVDKKIISLDREDVVLGDRVNMAYLGSSVTYGRGIGIVTTTGMDTEMGHIAKIISSTESSETPLQKKLAELSKFLSFAVIGICLIIFSVGLIRDGFNADNASKMFMTAISLAVAAIPEGLPAVVTIVLAMGVQRMASRSAIIRRLPAVETLGSTEIICSDKTGTLTQNKMTVQEIFTDNKLVSTGESKNLPGNNMMVKALVLCNDSKMSENAGSVKYVGDPTETALVAYAYDLGVDKRKADTDFSRVGEIPFDSDRKLMSTINKIDNEFVFFTKGAPDVLVGRCDRILVDGKVVNITDDHKKLISEANKNMADKALRVLATAYKNIDQVPAQEDLVSDKYEKGLIFIGLVGMIDPARPEVKDAVKVCKEAGVRAVMITGDHRDTAVAIAKELGIIDDESGVITGAELDTISEKDFEDKVVQYSVYARVSPEHKVRIVKAWKNRGKIVAMTGDGVNDAPALKTSDIGVGMGITGTDVSKGVADMVLSDDNFATIVFAVEEGRKIYSNIRKTVQFLLSTNMSEVFSVFIATLSGFTLLQTIQILWVNLVTDSFPALALGVEKGEPDIMKQPPRDAKKSFFADGLGVSVVYQGVILGTITLLAYFIGNGFGDRYGNTMAFATLSLSQLFHSFNLKSRDKSIFQVGIFSNMWLVGSFVLCSALMAGVIMVPALANIFRVIPLDLIQWAIVIGLSFAIIPIVEVVKLIQRSIKKN